MRDRYVHALSQVGDAGMLGNKALNLRFLSKQDFPVPVTLVCSADAYSRYIQGDPHITRMVREELARVIDPQRAYAVRSSASLEDGQDYSWAGQFKTELDVRGVEAIMQAVQAVWDSSRSPAAHAYMGQVAQDLRDLRMSVIVQEMVSPVVSGVAFSRNPMTGLDEVVVEAVPGSGEALVQDGVTPERWVHKWGQWAQKPGEPHISSQVIEQVVAQTRSIARTYGKPVDLEWVYDGQKLHWVQLRQITSLRNVSVYSNRIAREMMPGIIKPLVWSVQVPIHARIHGELIQELAGPNQVRIQDLVKAFYYQAYFNMGVIGDVLEMVGMPRDAIETMIGIDIPKDQRPPFKPTWKTMRLLPRMLAFVWRIWRYGGNLPTTIPKLEAQWRGLPADDVAALGESELTARVERLIQMLEDVERCNLRTQILMMTHHGILQGQLRKLGLDVESMTQEPSQRSAASYNVTGHLQALHAAWDALDAGVQEQVRGATFAELDGIQGAAPFRDALQRFVVQFGHLSDSSNDFSAVSWGENPDRILRIAIEYQPPQAKRAATRIDEVKMPRLKRAFLRKLAQRTQGFQQHREEIGFLFTYGNGMMRRHLLALGDCLAQRGLVASPGDVFCLSWDEVRTLATGGELPTAPHELIDRRKLEMDTARKVTPPSTIYGDTPAPLEQPLGDRLAGTPTSMGYYQGPVKVVRGLEDFGKMQRGDVLVIPYSDIGWTPLFAQAGAVVAESGGMLSHSSIVAREYRIPAVVSVPGACALADGTPVTVDGYKGEIVIHGAALTRFDLARISPTM